jgi:hypothetical protein
MMKAKTMIITIKIVKMKVMMMRRRRRRRK